MRLSTKSRYGLRVLVQIALDNIHGEKLSSGRRLAKKQSITEPYLEQIMIPLKKAGIISTIRGCNGGYKLKKAPEEITVLNVIEIFEGKIDLASCNKYDEKCFRLKQCPTKTTWNELSETFRKEANLKNIATVVKDFQQQQQQQEEQDKINSQKQ